MHRVLRVTLVALTLSLFGVGCGKSGGPAPVATTGQLPPAKEEIKTKMPL